MSNSKNIKNFEVLTLRCDQILQSKDSRMIVGTDGIYSKTDIIFITTFVTDNKRVLLIGFKTQKELSLFALAATFDDSTLKDLNLFDTTKAQEFLNYFHDLRFYVQDSTENDIQNKINEITKIITDYNTITTTTDDNGLEVKKWLTGKKISLQKSINVMDKFITEAENKLSIPHWTTADIVPSEIVTEAAAYLPEKLLYKKKDNKLYPDDEYPRLYYQPDTVSGINPIHYNSASNGSVFSSRIPRGVRGGRRPRRTQRRRPRRTQRRRPRRTQRLL